MNDHHAAGRLGRVAKLQRALGWLMLAVFFASVVTWWTTREVLPPRIQIATAAEGGLYHKFGSVLAPHLEERTGRPVVLRVTAGSGENLSLLLAGDADLALLQGETAGSDSVRALTPLFRDVLHVVARVGSGVESIAGLAGRSVAIGPANSGMRSTASTILQHYGVETGGLEGSERYFGAMADDSEIDAALVTTGLLNPDLEALLGSGGFELLPVRDAEALAIRNPFLTPFQIPRGFYREDPPVPPAPVSTVATTTVLAVREDAGALLVKATLATLYENDLRRDVPILMRRRQVAVWDELPQHPAAADYFRPYSGIGLLADMMESAAALEELIFALGAALYLGWSQWQRIKSRERERAVQLAKEHLDVFFEETMRIEKAQMQTDDASALRGFLDAVTAIKLRAIRELTDEDLRADTSFSIFLQQCANLTRKIQSKIDYVGRGKPYPRAAPPKE